MVKRSHLLASFCAVSYFFYYVFAYVHQLLQDLDEQVYLEKASEDLSLVPMLLAYYTLYPYTEVVL
jgi:hypothetical protein